MNTGNCDLQSESDKEIEDVKLLVESMKYQKDDPSQQQQALRALGEILSQNSKLSLNYNLRVYLQGSRKRGLGSTSV